MDRLRLVLVETEGPVNLGFIARLAENFEVDELVLVRPKADLGEAARYAARAAWRLEEARIAGSLGEALAGASLSICTSSWHSTGRAARIPVDVREAAGIAAASPGTVAVVMGRESVGLTLRELEECDLMATIPASPRYPSLNLSNATAIVLYEIYRARRGPRLREPPGPETRRLLEAYAAALSDVVVSDESKRGEVRVAARRIAGVLDRREAELLLYLLSRACKRVEGCGGAVRGYLQPGPRGPAGEGGGRGDRGAGEDPLG